MTMTAREAFISYCIFAARHTWGQHPLSWPVPPRCRPHWWQFRMRRKLERLEAVFGPLDDAALARWWREVERGQSVHEDAGGYFRRCYMGMLGAPVEEILTYDQANEALLARAAKAARGAITMTEIAMRETMWAEMKPDCYGGASCDQILPRWSTYAAGDKDGDDSMRALQLAARTFPPGTKVVISEPVCPTCGETRCVKSPVPKRGSIFEEKCSCGFDWEAWTIAQYS